MTRKFSWQWVAILASNLVIAGTAAAEVRTWSDSTGKFKVEAELVSAQDGKVQLRKVDGKEITVPLKRLTEADQAFVKESLATKSADDAKPASEAGAKSIDKAAAKSADSAEAKSASKPAAKSAGKAAAKPAGKPDANPESKAIAKLAQKFYLDLRTEKRDQARGVMTEAAQKLATDANSLLAALPTPDKQSGAIRAGVAKIDGTQAEIPVQVRVGGKSQKTTLHFRNEDDQWRVFAISATLGDEEKTLNFEAAPVASAEKAEDPLLALVGQKLDVEGYTLDGKPVSMAQFKGKVVLIDFWATWCGPCRAEIPNILANWNQYHDSGFEVIAISVDQDLEVLSKFVAEEKPPWTVVADHHPKNQNSMGNKFRIRGIPAFVLVGKDGKVAAVHCRGQSLGQQLAQLLGAPKAGATASLK